MSSMLVKLRTGKRHVHNGQLYRSEEELRVPDDVAVQMVKRGDADYVTGAKLAAETKQRAAKKAGTKKKK